ncbi:heme acquisition protein HasA [Phytopseudomonas daroniae]|uniref:heme acquisition protein HasA n=1 Tax=Phytopseudomonas daroniae TaxID=2487519 RepID=UPI00103854B5|nr:heme acquisition protein HasA [Pseudomonas daroniae]TBU75929.1 hypothetical protein DNK10_08060 [Pseudomonas daroniae]
MSTVTVGYNESYFPYDYYADDTFKDVLEAWASSGIPGTHPTNTGGFFTGGVDYGNLYGDTYAFTTGNGYAFSVQGNLTYDFDLQTYQGTHTVYGTVNSISFGGGLTGNGTVNNPFLTITFDTPLTSELSEGFSGDVHEVVYGLMNANVSALLAVLESGYGVDVDVDTIEDLGTPFASLVGVAEAEDYLLAA